MTVYSIEKEQIQILSIVQAGVAWQHLPISCSPCNIENLNSRYGSSQAGPIFEMYLRIELVQGSGLSNNQVIF